jgi:hypothetical protein
MIIIDNLLKRTSLSAEDAAALCVMIDNGSSVESMCDEFDVDATQLKHLSGHIADAASAIGGRDRLLSAIERAYRPPSDDGTMIPQDRSEIASQRKSGRRTSAGLRDILFGAMDKLIDGNISPQDAAAIAGLSEAICKTVKLEMEADRMRRDQSFGGDEGPRTLILGGNDGSD